MNQDNELSALQQRMLEILTQNGAWMSRSQLATALKRPANKRDNTPRLYPSDLQNLKALVEKGYIKRKKAQIEKDVFITHYVYRIKHTGE